MLDPTRHDDPGHYLFLASAIAGRRVAVHIAKGSHPLAACDGLTIFLLPPQLRADHPAWLDVAAQASLIAAGSLAPALLRKLVGRSAIAQRYGYLEVLRASRVCATRLPTFFLLQAELHQAEVLSNSAEASLEIALSPRVLPDAPAWFGSVRPMMVLRRSVSESGLSALTTKQARGDFEQAQLPELDEDEDAEESKIMKLFSSPLGGNNPLANLLNTLLGAGTSKSERDSSSAGSEGAEMPVGRIARALRRGINAVRAQLPQELPEIDAHAQSAPLSYPEWDTHERRYKPNWALVEEVDPWRPDGAREVDPLLGSTSSELKRQLGSLGLDHEMHRHQREGSDLDSGRLLDVAIELAGGHSPPSLDVYRASRRTRRDLAVVIALDVSGSTGERSGSGRPVFDQQVQVAYQLGRALNDLGDMVAMFGFHSWGRKLVRSVRIKGAEERWGTQTTERIALLEPAGYTRTGAAVRHGAHVLNKTMRLPNRLLVLITDGIAYDHDYEASYAEGDARKALEEARATGTAVVCLCVGGSESAAKLREVFGAANLLIVDEPDQITRSIRRICQQALGGVARRDPRRAAQARLAG